MQMQVSVLSIPLRYSFSHAAASRTKSSSILVEIKRRRHVGFGEGCPREYVTGETINGAVEWIKKISASLIGITTISSLREWVLSNEIGIDQNPSAWCAVETAFLDLLGKESDQTIDELINIKTNKITQNITAVISDGSSSFVDSLISKCLAFGFTDFKIKLSGELEKDLEKVAMLKCNLESTCSVRVDFNNVFSSVDTSIFLRYLEKINYNFSAIEEPFEPHAITAMTDIGELFNIPIILDESFTNVRDIERIGNLDNFIPNIRISKMGGLLRTLNLLELTKENISQFILGSLVGETSILSRLWLIVAGCNGQRLYAGEGAYSTHILAVDVTESPIIIEPPGIISVPEKVLESSGLGIEISPNTWKYMARLY